MKGFWVNFSRQNTNSVLSFDDVGTQLQTTNLSAIFLLAPSNQRRGALFQIHFLRGVGAQEVGKNDTTQFAKAKARHESAASTFAATVPERANATCLTRTQATAQVCWEQITKACRYFSFIHPSSKKRKKKKGQRVPNTAMDPGRVTPSHTEGRTRTTHSHSGKAC